MSNRKLFAMFALGTAFAVTAALPAFAHHGHPVAAPGHAAQAGFTTSNPQGVTVHWQRVPHSGGPGFMLKSECSGRCSNGATFSCSGDTASCTDGQGCTSSGGGVGVTVTCNAS
jgi:hypothetical protein